MCLADVMRKTADVSFLRVWVCGCVGVGVGVGMGVGVGVCEFACVGVCEFACVSLRVCVWCVCVCARVR